MTQSSLQRGIGFTWVYLEEIIANTALAIMVLASIWAVVSRYIIPTPAVWSIEVVTVAFAWTIFVGSAAVYKRRQHVSVDLLVTCLPGRWRPYADRATDMLVALLCFISAYHGLQQSIASHDAITGVANIPLSVPFMGFTLGMLFMGTRAVQAVIGYPWVLPVKGES